MKVKQQLYKQCAAYIDKRLQTVKDIISSNQTALESETKSSVGDKHETGRAMLQLEIEKAGNQLISITQMQQTLAKINVDNLSRIACLGSVIYTEKVNYFLSISCGKLTADNKQFFAVSVSSPIGKLLLGKQVGDSFLFNGKKITIRFVN